MRRFICAAVWSAVTIAMALAFYDRHWQWRGCFNELGRCYDPVSQTVLLEQAGIFWGGLAAISFGVAAFHWLRALRKRATWPPRVPLP